MKRSLGKEAALEPAGLLHPALVCRAVVKCDKFGSPALHYHCCLSGLVKKAAAVHNQQHDSSPATAPPFLM